MPSAETSTSRSTISATASTDMPRASHWRGSLTSTVCSTWSWLRMDVVESSVTLCDEELEHVLVLVEREVVAAEARLEHAEVGAEGARVDAVRRPAPARSGRWPSPCGAGSRGSRRARCPRRRGPRAAGRPGSPRGTTGRARRTWARCSCRRSRGCRPRCGASGRCSRSAVDGAGLRTIALSSSSTASAASSRRSRVRGAGRACQAVESALRTCRRSLRLELQVVADRAPDVVGRQRVLVREQLVGAHQQGHAAPVGVADAGAVAVAAASSSVRRSASSSRSASARRRGRAAGIDEKPSAPARRRKLVAAVAGERASASCGPLGPLQLAAHRRHGVGRRGRAPDRRVERHPVRAAPRG